MADLATHADDAVPDAAFEDNAGADAGAEGEHGHGVDALVAAGAELPLGECGGVGVAVEDDGEAGEVFEGRAEREEVPAGEVGELAEGAVGEIERAGAAEADGFGAGGGLVEERGDGVGHVGDDGLRAGAHARGHDAAGEELHAGVECADAKAGAAEIDAEVHERALVVRRNGAGEAGSQRASGDAARMTR